MGLNSDNFGVTPGQPFTLTFRARVDPPTNSSGYFDIVFLTDSGEGTRFTVPIQIARVVIGSTQTGDDGSYSFPMTGLPAGMLQVRAWFDGNDDTWPAMVEQQFSP